MAVEGILSVAFCRGSPDERAHHKSIADKHAALAEVQPLGGKQFERMLYLAERKRPEVRQVSPRPYSAERTLDKKFSRPHILKHSGCVADTTGL